MSGSRSRRLKLNTFSSLILQIATFVCGFILPRLILKTYGSAVNGLVNSILQFLQIIAFLELGVGAVVQSSLYKPLAEKNKVGVSQIVASASKFFQRIAAILLVYVIVLMAVYPWMVRREFGWLYTATMIAVISISSFAQYYFGMVDGLLLSADQRGYVQFVAQTVTVVANTAACFVLIRLGASLHLVKLTTSLIYVARPLFLRWYVNRHYRLDRKVTYTGEPIKQKWNGMAQHIASVVLDGTDNIVLTVFSTLANVSIYSVYNLVVHGVKQMCLSLTRGVQSLIGELWAKQELDALGKTFGTFEWAVHTGTVFVFGCTGTLLVPFVRVYTQGVTDVDYIQPLFAVLITLAQAGHCLRLPYNVMILAGGHYKQTQSNYIIAAVLNIVISIATVIPFGLIGVALGTLAAMLYQTIWMAVYTSKNLICWPIRKFVKQMAADLITVAVGVAASGWLTLQSVSYLSWVWMAVQAACIWLAAVVAVNALLYRQQLAQLMGRKKKSKG